MTVRNPDGDWQAEALAAEAAADKAEGAARANLLGQATDHWSEAGEHERAADVLTRIAAETGDPEDAASPLLAYSLLKLGRADEAQAVVRAAEELAAAGRSWSGYQELGDLLALAGRSEQALSCYDAALRLLLMLDQPDLPDPRLPEIRPLSTVRKDRLRIREDLGLAPDEHDRAAIGALSLTDRWRRARRKRR